MDEFYLAKLGLLGARMEAVGERLHMTLAAARCRGASIFDSAAGSRQGCLCVGSTPSSHFLTHLSGFSCRTGKREKGHTCEDMMRQPVAMGLGLSILSIKIRHSRVKGGVRRSLKCSRFRRLGAQNCYFKKQTEIFACVCACSRVVFF